MDESCTRVIRFECAIKQAAKDLNPSFRYFECPKVLPRQGDREKERVKRGNDVQNVNLPHFSIRVGMSI